MGVAGVLIVGVLAIGGTVISFAVFFALLRIPSKLDAWREHFFRNLLRFVRHGVPLTVGVERLSDSAGWPYGGWLAGVALRMSEGVPLDEAVCPTERDTIGPITVPSLMPEADARLLRRATEGVPLEVVLGQLAAKYKARVDFRQRLRTQLLLPIYLLFFLSTGSGVLLGFTEFIEPAFASLFAELGSPEMSALVQDGMRAGYLAAPLGIVLVLGMALVYFIPRNRRFRNLLVRLPFARGMVRHAEWALIGRHLEAAVACERPLSSALADLPSDSFTAPTAAELDGLVESLGEGTPPLEALDGVALPRGWHALIAVGLAGSGGLARQIGQASDYLEETLSIAIGRTERVFGGAVVLGAGVVVGLMVSGVFAALVGIVELVA